MIHVILSFFSAIAFLAGPPAAAPVLPPAPAVTVPPPPATVPAPEFAAQAAGRGRLCDALYALMTAPRYSHQGTYRLATFGDDGKLNNDFSGTEAVSWDRKTNRLAFVATSGGGKSVTRYASDGKTLLGVRLEGRNRTFYRVPLQGDTSLVGDALIAVDADRMYISAVTRLTLFGRVADGSLRSPNLVYESAKNEVIEQVAPRDDKGHRLITYYRYRFAPGSPRITTREQWDTWQDAAKPVLIRSYENGTFSVAPPAVTATTFLTKPPVGAVEVPPPSTTRTPPLRPGPERADPKARALLLRWARAWARFTSFQAQVHVREGELAQTPESMAPDPSGFREALIDVSYQRPGKMFLASHPTGPPNAFRLTQNLVSDGQKFVIYEGARRERKRGEGDNMDDPYLNDRLRDNGLFDFSEVVPRILRNPRELVNDSNEGKYRGMLPLPGGGAAEVVTLTQLFGGNGPLRLNGDVGAATRQQIITLYFDAKSGLPLRSEFELRWLLSGRSGEMLRDLPPNQFRVADFGGLRVNEELPPSLFDLSGK